MLAIKVVANNEYKQLADRLGVDWAAITDIARTDYRLGATHWSVPGPDGEPGFGGACFPKDTAALCHMARSHNVALDVLETAITKNQHLKAK